MQNRLLERTVRQQSIIEAARKIIFLKGIESLTVREIAKELNITNGALYRHFKSKKEILSLLIDDIEETLLTTIREAADAQGDVIEKLKNIFLSHLSYAERMKGTSFAIINEVSAIKDKNLQRKMLNILNRYLNIIQKIVVQGMEEGVFRKDIDPFSASTTFFGSVQSLITLWRLSGYRLSLSQARLEKTFNVYKNIVLVG